MKTVEVIDAHVHCGIQDRSPPQDFDSYVREVVGSPIRSAVMFAPVAEIYDRWDPLFVDTPRWQERRSAANAYLLHIGDHRLKVIPYFFIWNDFAVEQLSAEYQGVKWHRHADEPVYHYANPRCQTAVAEIRRRNLPIVLEEELSNTLRFLDEWGVGTRIVIPHLGMLNGGYRALKDRGIWSRPNVWADTALADTTVIQDYIASFGTQRLLFGSDFPFGDPLRELEKIRRLHLPPEVESAVLGENLLRMLSENRL